MENSMGPESLSKSQKRSLRRRRKKLEIDKSLTKELSKNSDTPATALSSVCNEAGTTTKSDIESQAASNTTILPESESPCQNQKRSFKKRGKKTGKDTSLSDKFANFSITATTSNSTDGKSDATKLALESPKTVKSLNLSNPPKSEIINESTSAREKLLDSLTRLSDAETMADVDDKVPQKTKQQLREEKKAAQQAKKAAAANKNKASKTPAQVGTPETPAKNEPASKTVGKDDKSPVEAKPTDKEEAKTDGEKTKAELKAERRRLFEMQRAAKQESEAKTSAVTEEKKATNDQTSKDEKPEKNQSALDGEKSKAELKAERRRKQEKQRAAKAAMKEGDATSKTAAPAAAKSVPKPNKISTDDASNQKKVAKKSVNQSIPGRATSRKSLGLFSHLMQYEKEPSITKTIKLDSLTSIHPAILHLGLQYSQGIIVGSNARCFALLLAFKKVISDYATPPQKELSRDLADKLKVYMSFLSECRPMAISMGNAIKFLKFQIAGISSKEKDAEAKERLTKAIDSFLYNNITSAQKLITQAASLKIVDGDVILTYACSSLIKAVLLEAYRQSKKFSVIVVDGRPKMEGKEMLRFLVSHGIKCSYVLINAVSYIMPEVTKVMLGAHSLQANGFVMSRIGSSQITLIAKSFNVPVLVCCETYKFCERVQADSFVFNELGDPNDLVRKASSGEESGLRDWKVMKHLQLLNLSYDVTSPNFVSAVITEKGMVPCTSVPVVLRVRQNQFQDLN